MADLRRNLRVDALDHLVVSGDLTNSAVPAEFQVARTLLSTLIEEFKMTAGSCIIVPGNHDLSWDEQVYEWKAARLVEKSGIASELLSKQGGGYLVRDPDRYPHRFLNFSKYLFHPLMQRPYPLEFESQVMPTFFPDSGLLFLGMNSGWEIDEFYKGRASIHPGAVARGLREAEQQVERSVTSGQWDPTRKTLRIAVWHHPVTGPEMMQDVAFLEQLKQAGVRLCLHGHVHEETTEVLYHLEADRMLVAGCGSFGAPGPHRPESTPRLYNLLTVSPELTRVRVDTRQMPRKGGAWRGWANWPSERPDERKTYYELKV